MAPGRRARGCGSPGLLGRHVTHPRCGRAGPGQPAHPPLRPCRGPRLPRSRGDVVSRLLSVALTTQAVRERRKTVTRRLGWLFLKPGTRLTLCEKVQGRRPGEPLVRICDVE